MDRLFYAPDLKRFRYPLLLLLVLALFAALVWEFLFLDFWNDEIYSLKYFVFNSYAAIVTDYHVPNNHILFNLLSRLYLRAIGEEGLFALMDHPWKLRLLPLGYALLTLWLTYESGRRLAHPVLGLLAAVVLATTLPYLNFALQIRGYGLSALWLMLLSYACLSYQQKPGFRYLPMAAVSSGLALYTLPSNLYVLLGGMAALFLTTLLDARSEGWAALWRQPSLALLGSLVLGTGIGLLLYAPVFWQVFSNPYVAYDFFKWESLLYYPKNLFLTFSSGRWGLWLLFAIGLLRFRDYAGWWRGLLLLALVLLMPLLLVFALGQAAPLRVFVNLAPVFALLLAAGIYGAFRFLPSKSSWQAGLLLLLAGYCTAVVSAERRQVKADLLAEADRWGRSQDLYHQYYSAHYRPMEELQWFKKAHYSKGDMVVQLDCEPHGLPNYLEKLGISYRIDENLDSLLLQRDTLYLITNFRNRLQGYPRYQVEQLSPAPNYHTILRCTVNPQLAQQLAIAVQAGGQQLLLQGISPVLIPDSLQGKALWMPEEASKNLGAVVQAMEAERICYLRKAKASPEPVARLLSLTHQLDSVVERDYFSRYHWRRRVAPRLCPDQLHFNGFGEGGFHLSPDQLYSPAFNLEFREGEALDAFIVQLRFRAQAGSGGILVLEQRRGAETLEWQGIKLQAYRQAGKDWHSLIALMQLPEPPQPGDRLKVYVWNEQKQEIRIDDFEVCSAVE